MTKHSTPEVGQPPLDHPRRKLIYELIQRQPGLNWNQIQAKTGLSVGALLFHVEKLEEADVVIRRPSTSENEVLFFTEDNVSLWRDPSTRVLFGNESTRKVARAIAETPGITTQEIAEQVGIHDVTVRYHLDKLDDHKLLIDEKDGRRKRYRPTDRLSGWMDEFGDEVDCSSLTHI